MTLRRAPLVVGLCAGIPTLLYLALNSFGLLPRGNFFWPVVHRSFVWITLATMAAVAGEGVLELKRDRSPLHVLRYSVFLTAAVVPVLGWCGSARFIPWLSIAYCLIALAFALLSAVELIRAPKREV
ncbi:MAG: hypothetical protein PHU21_14580, partial [Elusimicrobia bacterium]|nr:hypothetical protein [Elusimicrobiota bacterium]